MFNVLSKAGDDSTVVSNLFIDEYMREANDAQLKIYLYLIRMMSACLPTSISDMADRFNHTEKEVLRSLRYWEKKGLLCLDHDERGKLSGIHLCELRKKPAPAAAERVISITPMLQNKSAGQLPVASGAETVPAPREIPSAEVLSAFQADKKRAQLLFIIEQYIGKPLSVKEIQTIYYISEQLRFSDDLIDYLLQYCVDRGKKDFRYIEKVAVNWAEGGITTPKQAERAVSSAAKTSRTGGKTPRNNNHFSKMSNNNYDFSRLEDELLDN